MIDLILEIIEKDISKKAEVTLFLESTRKWVRQVKLTGLKDGVVFFRTNYKGKVVSSATYVENITDLALIWQSERDMLENDWGAEVIKDPEEGQELFFNDDDEDDYILRL